MSITRREGARHFEAGIREGSQRSVQLFTEVSRKTEYSKRTTVNRSRAPLGALPKPLAMLSYGAVRKRHLAQHRLQHILHIVGAANVARTSVHSFDPELFVRNAVGADNG